MKQGQTTLEYIVLIGAVAAALIAVIVYVSRGQQGNLRSQADQLGAGQYAPGNTNIANSEKKTLTSTAKVGSTTIVTYGNLNEPNKPLEDKLKEIAGKWGWIYERRQGWGDAVVKEATDGAAAVRKGDINFVWNPPVPPADGLLELEKELSTANTDLNNLIKEAKDLADKWPKRTPDQVSSSSIPSTEEGTITTKKSTSETLGGL